MKIKEFFYLIYVFFLVNFYNLLKRFKNLKKNDGVNLIGFPNGDFGIGQHIRLVTNAFTKLTVNFCVNESDLAIQHSHSNNEVKNFISKENKYNINLFCMNGTQVWLYMTRRLNEIIKSQYNIGYGYWELSTLPKIFTKQFKYLDEVWAPSKFIYDTMKHSTNLPVFHMPIPVEFQIPHHISRKDFNLPKNKFLFLFSFDMSSYITRKNPEAVIQCFKNAFSDNDSEKVGLVIKLQKIKNDLKQEIDFNEFINSFNANNIYTIDEVLEREKMLGLINSCDVYVSLHRSEGFGLGLAEAMYMGKNVIGTNYSGNVDFMNADNSCLVPYKLIELKKGEYLHYKQGMVWADPDLSEATSYMRKLFYDKNYRNKLQIKAQEDIKKYHSFEAISRSYEKRINEIQKLINKKHSS
ncbi:hypothetical protein NEF87_004272 [Candidatus Lokiarchaeum ossiferum]|uniref:Glycosyl transferase family 1 domain-containing protein n=1 Tax=Candidatus Lokiarchaeum ossiferum TaxID=2951803 RepID=A0ABY6HWU6_9ARCH|nr:hypothetical protein NEF87_004272 [Candidatus Lokiarchaeum sp. B-35]